MSISSLPSVSALVSLYSGTICKDFVAAYYSLFDSTIIPDQVVVVLDGPVSRDVYKFVTSLVDKNLIDIVVLEKNLGLGLALMEGVKACNCDLVMRFDSDDINLPGRLNDQIGFLLDNTLVDIVGSYVIEHSPRLHLENTIHTLKTVPLSDKSIKSSMCFRNPLNHPTILFRRSSLQKIGSYENVMYFEDYFLWLKARKAGLVFANIPIPLVKMARNSILERRTGYRYFVYEIKFILLSAKRRLITPFDFLTLTSRALIRLFPFNLFLLRFLMTWRKKI